MSDLRKKSRKAAPQTVRAQARSAPGRGGKRASNFNFTFDDIKEATSDKEQTVNQSNDRKSQGSNEQAGSEEGMSINVDLDEINIE